MTVLDGVLGSEIGDLILCFHKVDGDLTFLHYFPYKELPQCDVLRARAVCALAGDVKCRCVVDVQRHAAEPFLEAQLQKNVAAEDCLLHGESRRHQFCLHCRLWS